MNHFICMFLSSSVDIAVGPNTRDMLQTDRVAIKSKYHTHSMIVHQFTNL